MEIRETIFSWRNSSVPVKAIFLAMIIISLLSAVYFLGESVFQFWLLTSVLTYVLSEKNQHLFNFVMLNYKFFEPQVIVKRGDQPFIDYSSNYFFLESVKMKNDDILFSVDKENTTGGAESGKIGQQYFITIDADMMMIHNQQETEAFIFHEIGHIRLKHSEMTGLIILVGYIVLVIFPLLLPIFWLVENYLSRQKEFAANRFAAEQTSNNSILSLLETTKNSLTSKASQTDWWSKFLFKSFSPKPSLDEQIADLKSMTVNS